MIRVAILCGGLEPGRDGVGDYTRELAVVAARMGYKLITVAIADSFVGKEGHGVQEGVPFHRLPASVAWPARVERLKTLLDEFDPEWVSVQFVPYSFHPRGWVHGLAKWIEPALVRPIKDDGGLRRRLLHIMFHELWLGVGHRVPWRHRIEGFWQRRGVLSFIRTMRPAVVHTSNPAYAKALRKQNVNCSILPLFGNIPLEFPTEAQVEAAIWWREELEKIGVRIADRGTWRFFGVFGTIHREWWPGDIFAAELKRSSIKKRRIALLTFGRPGVAGDEVIGRLEKEFAGHIVFHRLGEQPAARVAEVLRDLDFGLATSPYSLIGKSGTVAAMREHGIPVIVTRVTNDDLRDFSTNAGEIPEVFPFTAALSTRLETIKRGAPKSNCREVASQWIDSLKPQ